VFRAGAGAMLALTIIDAAIAIELRRLGARAANEKADGRRRLP